MKAWKGKRNPEKWSLISKVVPNAELPRNYHIEFVRKKYWRRFEPAPSPISVRPRNRLSSYFPILSRLYTWHFSPKGPNSVRFASVLEPKFRKFLSGLGSGLWGSFPGSSWNTLHLFLACHAQWSRVPLTPHSVLFLGHGGEKTLLSYIRTRWVVLLGRFSALTLSLDP